MLFKKSETGETHLISQFEQLFYFILFSVVIFFLFLLSVDIGRVWHLQRQHCGFESTLWKHNLIKCIA